MVSNGCPSTYTDEMKFMFRHYKEIDNFEKYEEMKKRMGADAFSARYPELVGSWEYDHLTVTAGRDYMKETEKLRHRVRQRHIKKATERG